MTIALVVLATVLTALSAGLFATFSYAVMPGLRRVDDVAFVASMRGINVAILNPVLALVLGGALLAGVAAVVAVVRTDGPWVVAAVGTGLHVAVLGVTAAVNVPLNDALERDGETGPGAARAAFERRWVRWNHLRTVLSVGALVAWVVAATALGAPA